jgi:ribosome maturation factor RimP
LAGPSGPDQPHQARISLTEALNGRKQFSGELRGSAGDDILIHVPGAGEVRLPFDALHSAKLVMTDKLIAATAPLSSEGADKISVEG